jgi:hypothetical protein
MSQIDLAALTRQSRDGPSRSEKMKSAERFCRHRINQTLERPFLGSLQAAAHQIRDSRIYYSIKMHYALESSGVERQELGTCRDVRKIGRFLASLLIGDVAYADWSGKLYEIPTGHIIEDPIMMLPLYLRSALLYVERATDNPGLTKMLLPHVRLLARKDAACVLAVWPYNWLKTQMDLPDPDPPFIRPSGPLGYVTDSALVTLIDRPGHKVAHRPFGGCP